MVHEVWVEDLVRRREVVLVLAHLHEVRHYPLVALDRHGFPFLKSKGTRATGVSHSSRATTFSRLAPLPIFDT